MVFYGKHHSEETRKKQSLAHRGHSVSKGAGYGKGSYYFSKEQNKWVWLRSTYELIYTQFLDSRNIRWLYESKRFDLGEIGTYTPDFFLSGLNEWHEVKGYWHPQAKKKFQLFKELYPNEKIIVVDREQINNIKKGLRLNVIK